MNVIIQKEKLEDVAASIREIGENENVDITIDPFPANEFGQQISGLDYMIPTAKTATNINEKLPNDITLELEFQAATMFLNNVKTQRATKIFKKVRNLLFHIGTSSNMSTINDNVKNNYISKISKLKTVFIPANMPVSSSSEIFAPFQVPNATREGMEIYTEEISKPASWSSTFEEVGITQQQEILYATVHYGVSKEEYLDIINSKHQY